MKNKKILIATGIFPPDIGGPATMLGNLAHSLKECGFEIKILTYIKKRINLETEKQKNNYKIYRININSIFAKINYFFKLLKLSKTVDVIYTTDTYSVGYFTYLIKKLTGKKYILRFTGDSAWETARANNWIKDYIVDFQEKKYNSKIEKLKKRRNKILFNADKIIVDCKFNKKLAKIIGVPAEKVEVIYNSIDFKISKIDKNKVQQIKNNYPGKIIMTACRLTPWKGTEKIIEILAEINSNINFLILGDGLELEKLKVESRKLKVESNVHFLGKISQDEIENYFSIADVFILNSQYEGLSHTLLEVMKIGRPIVASNCGGNSELIENNQTGLLVEYGNNSELQNAILKILNDAKLAEKFSQNAKEKIKEFKWKNVLNQTIKIIQNL